MERKNSKILSFILLFFISVGLNPVYSNNNLLNIMDFPSSQQENEVTSISCIILENYSISSMNSYITFTITTDVATDINYIINSVGINSKVIPDQQEISIDAGLNDVKIPINIGLDALPGEYHYTLRIQFKNGTSYDNLYLINDGTVKITTGGILLLILGTILMVGVFAIGIKNETLLQDDYDSSKAQIYSPDAKKEKGDTEEGEVGEGFIRCPECKKKIKEGSSFCPECGFHIPKFYRTQQ